MIAGNRFNYHETVWMGAFQFYSQAVLILLFGLA
jgi:hypothetical protein